MNFIHLCVSIEYEWWKWGGIVNEADLTKRAIKCDEQAFLEIIHYIKNRFIERLLLS